MPNTNPTGWRDLGINLDARASPAGASNAIDERDKRLLASFGQFLAPKIHPRHPKVSARGDLGPQEKPRKRQAYANASLRRPVGRDHLSAWRHGA